MSESFLMAKWSQLKSLVSSPHYPIIFALAAELDSPWISIWKRQTFWRKRMPSPESVITRLVAKIKAVLEEDWLGAAGRRFRHTLSKISDLNRKHLHLEERASAAPDLAWNAVQGIASEKLAKATSD